MGASLVRHRAKRGHKGVECAVFDGSSAAVRKIADRGVRGSAAIDELVAKLGKPRVARVMVSARRCCPIAAGFRVCAMEGA